MAGDPRPRVGVEECDNAVRAEERRTISESAPHAFAFSSGRRSTGEPLRLLSLNPSSSAQDDFRGPIDY